MRCKHCLSDKDSAEFYVSNRSRCKACVKAAVSANRLANIESVRQYDRMRGSMPHRVAARAEYQRTPAFSESHQAAVKRWIAAHPERRAANVSLNNAVRRGKVKPWPVCAVPECCARPEGHHPDYSEPLSVVWLCNEHHQEVHAQLEEASWTKSSKT